MSWANSFGRLRMIACRSADTLPASAEEHIRIFAEFLGESNNRLFAGRRLFAALDLGQIRRLDIDGRRDLAQRELRIGCLHFEAFVANVFAECVHVCSIYYTLHNVKRRKYAFRRRVPTIGFAMRTFEWAIEDVMDAYPAMSLEHAAAMAVALMRNTGSPCRFAVFVHGFEIETLDGDSQFALEIAWNAKTEANARRMERTEQRKPIVERAAIAVAALLISHLIPDSDLEVLKQSERADYWLPATSNRQWKSAAPNTAANCRAGVA